MFQFRGFATVSTCLQHVRLPHSDTYGSRFVCNSPYIFAAYRVLRRLREPRHPPCALGSLPSLCHTAFTCDRRFSLNYRFFYYSARSVPFETSLRSFCSSPSLVNELFIELAKFCNLTKTTTQPIPGSNRSLNPLSGQKVYLLFIIPSFGAAKVSNQKIHRQTFLTVFLKFFLPQTNQNPHFQSPLPQSGRKGNPHSQSTKYFSKNFLKISSSTKTSRPFTWPGR